MTRNARAIAAAGALSAGLAVALGAFGAHALEGVLTPERLATFETAVRYQFLHALALLVLAQAPLPEGAQRRIALLLLGGSAVFAGALYALIATGIGVWGAVAPIGGAAMIAGWLGWGVAAAFGRRP